MFESAKAKLDRADEHANAFYREFREAEGELFTADFQVEDHRLPDGRLRTDWTLLITDAPQSSLRDGTLIADAFENARSALDHMTWELVCRHHRKPLPAKRAKDVQFPIARTRSSFKEQVSRRMPGLSKDYWTLAERYQPYRRTPVGRVMRTLRNFSDREKHRVIIPVVTIPAASDIEFKAKGTELVSTVFHFHDGSHVKRGTKIATLTTVGGKPGERAMYVDGMLGVTSMLPGRLVLEPTLSAIFDTCTDVLTEFERLARI